MPTPTEKTNCLEQIKAIAVERHNKERNDYDDGIQEGWNQICYKIEAIFLKKEEATTLRDLVEGGYRGDAWCWFDMSGRPQRDRPDWHIVRCHPDKYLEQMDFVSIPIIKPEPLA